MTQRKQLPEFSFTNLLKGFIFSNVGEAKGTLLKRFVSSKMAFECTISTSESICFGELRKCPSALWAYIESGIGFWLSGKDLRQRWFVYCQAGLKTIGLEYMPEKDGVAWRMEWDGPEVETSWNWKGPAFCYLMKESYRSFPKLTARIRHHIFQHLLLQFTFCHTTTSKSEKFSQNRNQKAFSLHDNFFTRPNKTLWDSNAKSILKEAITNSGYISSQRVLSRETYVQMNYVFYFNDFITVPQSFSTFEKSNNWTYQNPILFLIVIQFH